MLPAMADTRGRDPVESLDELNERARELLRGLGYPARPEF